MTKFSINVTDSLHIKEPRRDQRIKENILYSPDSKIELIATWHQYLNEQISFPLQAMMISADSTSRVIKSNRIKLIKLALLQRCFDRHILIVGIGPFYDEFANYYFMEDMQQLEADMKSIEAILDYRYWLKHMI